MILMNGLYPAVVEAYYAEDRYCDVSIDGITTGSEDYLKAEIQYSLGDKSEDTEIEILAGDKVWVMFHGGDPRYPIITGYRTLNSGASTDTRRWHKENIILEADDNAKVVVGGENGSLIDATPLKIKLTVGNAEITAENNKMVLKVGERVIELTNTTITQTSGKSKVTMSDSAYDLEAMAYNATQAT